MPPPVELSGAGGGDGEGCGVGADGSAGVEPLSAGGRRLQRTGTRRVPVLLSLSHVSASPLAPGRVIVGAVINEPARLCTIAYVVKPRPSIEGPLSLSVATHVLLSETSIVAPRRAIRPGCRAQAKRAFSTVPPNDAFARCRLSSLIEAILPKHRMPRNQASLPPLGPA